MRRRYLDIDRPTASRNYYDLDFVFIFTFRARLFPLLLLPAFRSRCDNDLSTPPLSSLLFALPFSLHGITSDEWWSMACPSIRIRAKLILLLSACQRQTKTKNIDEKLLFVDKMPTTFPFIAHKYFFLF